MNMCKLSFQDGLHALSLYCLYVSVDKLKTSIGLSNLFTNYVMI